MVIAELVWFDSVRFREVVGVGGSGDDADMRGGSSG
jgi:hypothetical protein